MTEPSIIESLQQSVSPDVFYLIIAILLIIIVYVLHKILRVLLFFLIIGTLALGLSALNGQDIGTMLAPVTSQAQDFFNNFLQSAKQEANDVKNNNSNQNGPGNENQLKDVISGVISKIPSLNK